MVKKITYLIISLAIVTSGIIGFSKLNYWQRSVRIFQTDFQQQQFERRGPGSGRQGAGQGAGMRREIPDSLRQRFHQERPDSLFRGGGSLNARNEGGGSGRIVGQGSRFRGEGGIGRGNGLEGQGRGDLRNGKKINLATVGWYFSIFASFAVIIIYIEKAVKLIRKKKQ